MEAIPLTVWRHLRSDETYGVSYALLLYLLVGANFLVCAGVRAFVCAMLDGGSSGLSLFIFLFLSFNFRSYGFLVELMFSDRIEIQVLDLPSSPHSVRP